MTILNKNYSDTFPSLILHYRGEPKIEEYLEESTGEDVEEGEDLGDTTFEDGRTVFFGLQMITPV